MLGVPTDIRLVSKSSVLLDSSQQSGEFPSVFPLPSVARLHAPRLRSA